MPRFELDSRTGGAVLIAPVSGRIPCKQGILQGNLQFWGSEACPLGLEPLRPSHFAKDSLVRLTGKHFGVTGNSQEETGYSGVPKGESSADASIPDARTRRLQQFPLLSVANG